MMIRKLARMTLGGLTFAAAFALGPARPAKADLTGDGARADAAREKILELSVKEAADLLKDAPADDALLALERGRLALYQGDCELAAGILARHDLEENRAALQLGEVARGCVRSMAGAVKYEDPSGTVVIRFQDDEDLVLGPIMADVAIKARDLYKTDLGTELPSPMRIEVVRDQFALSAMTGLAYEAARTTGTVAIAKWGRVVMVSPRAAPKGYGFLDTLAHELSHLAQTRASKDLAPLWLQEGVARIEESRWRPLRPFDDTPPADDLSFFGFKNHIGPDIDRIGPSIAMLSSAMEAQVTYGKVMSFMRYWSATAGDGSLTKLLHAISTAKDPEDIEKSIQDVSGTSFSDWKTRWEKEIEARAKDLPDETRPNAPPNKKLPETRKRVRLGELFEDRSHAKAAKKEYGSAFDLAPREAIVRAHLATTLLDLDDTDRAKELVANAADVYANDSRWWALRALLIPAEAESAFAVALGLDPLDPTIACKSFRGKETPSDPAMAALCEAARRKPREP
jgi:hypothetical protein